MLCMVAQAQGVHCISIEESRMLHEDAVRAHVQEAILQNNVKEIKLLKEEKITLKNDYAELLRTAEEKSKKQEEKLQQTEVILNTRTKERDHFEDLYKRQKIIGTLKILGIGVLGASAGYFAGKVF